MEKITNFLLNLVKVPTQFIYGLAMLVITPVFLLTWALMALLSEIWPLGALVLVWYFWF